MKRMVAFVLVISLFTCLCACGNSKSDIEKFDGLVNSLSESSREEAAKILNELGFQDVGQTSHIDRAFIEEYLETHSVEEFFDNLYDVDQYMREYNFTYNYRYDKVKHIIATALEVADLQTVSVDISNDGALGFYTEHAEDYPRISTKEVEGKFYNSSGGNVHYQTRTCRNEYTYFGDFAVMHSTGYSYDKGEYGWINGKFYDELPSWRKYDNYYLEYKGDTINNKPFSTEFWTAVKNVRCLVVGSTTYIIFDSPEAFYGESWLRI